MELELGMVKIPVEERDTEQNRLSKTAFIVDC